MALASSVLTLPGSGVGDSGFHQFYDISATGFRKRDLTEAGVAVSENTTTPSSSFYKPTFKKVENQNLPSEKHYLNSGSGFIGSFLSV